MYYALKKEAADRIRRVFKDDADALILLSTLKANYVSKHFVHIETNEGNVSVSLSLSINEDFECIEENPVNGLIVQVVDISNIAWCQSVVKKIVENGHFFLTGSLCLLVVSLALDIFK